MLGSTNYLNVRHVVRDLGEGQMETLGVTIGGSGRCA